MKSANKIFDILDLFLKNEPELSLEEISRLNNINIYAVRRIVKVLVERGYLKKLNNRGGYSLGMRFLDFSSVIKRSDYVLEISEPHAIKLCQTLNETVMVVLWDGIKAVICQSFQGSHPLNVRIHEGTLLGMHATALGKAILAEIPQNQIENLFHDGLMRYTANTITEINDLRHNLLIVRQEGIAFDDEEFTVGVRGLGSIIRSGEKNILGAIGILGPSVRLSREKIREIAPVVKNCATAISRDLGYKTNST